MKILLAKGPFARLLGSDVYSLYPLGLMYVAAMLEQRGHDVAIYHDDVSNPQPIPSNPARFKPMSVPLPSEEMLQPFVNVLDGFQPDVVGVSYCTADRGSAHAVAALAKQRGIRTVAGGVHPSLLPVDALSLFDAAVVGEGDNPFAASAFETEDTGYLVVPPVENLDAIMPNRNAVIGGERYPQFLRGMVHTQRGCPYNCGFCAAPKVFGRKVRMRDPGLVREEVETLGVSTGRIIDDSFGVNRKHGLAVCRELAKTNFKWVCDVALQDIDDERIEAWVEGGCTQINIGIESAVPRWQELSGKHVKPGQPELILEKANKKGLGVVFYFMIGYPGETYAEMQQTLHYANSLKELGAIPCISIVTPYPKTAIFDMLHGADVAWDWSQFVHQSDKMGFADCTAKEWQKVVAEGNRING